MLRTETKKEMKEFAWLEMWTYWRMLRVPRMVKRINISILSEYRMKQGSSSVLYQQILRFFGHITRGQEDNLEKLAVPGKVESIRSCGRSPERRLDQVEELLDQRLEQLIRSAEDCKVWQEMMAGDCDVLSSGPLMISEPLSHGNC